MPEPDRQSAVMCQEWFPTLRMKLVAGGNNKFSAGILAALNPSVARTISDRPAQHQQLRPIHGDRNPQARLAPNARIQAKPQPRLTR